MNPTLQKFQKEVFQSLKLEITHYQVEKESAEYEACRFLLSGCSIISRKAKTTPTKTGQFVTIWRRNEKGTIEPLHESEHFDFLIVNVNSNNRWGQFVFPKSVLIQKGIISTDQKEGKRAFRVYPKWDVVNSKQAERSQQWQLDYFYELENGLDLERVRELYAVHL